MRVCLLNTHVCIGFAAMAIAACSDSPAPIDIADASPDASAYDLQFVDASQGPDGQELDLPQDAAGDTVEDLADASPQIPSTPPFGLSTVVGKGAVALHWSSLAKAAIGSFNIYWSTMPGVSKALSVKVANVQSGHVIDGLTNGATYYFAVSRVVLGNESDLSPEVQATPEGVFVPVFVGSGQIQDLAANQTTSVPVENRIHVLVLPEGYLSGELAQFDVDVQSLLTAVWKLDVYAARKDAFVFWKLPQASTEHVAAASPQTANTAFSVPITTAGTGIDSSGFTSTATKVWAALNTFHYPVIGYYAFGGRTSYLAKNILAHILVFNPAKGKSGMSGRTVSMKNPEDSKQRLSTAIAVNLAHEFTHAFGRLGDEYLDDGLGSLGQTNALTGQSKYVHNVVDDNTCDDLPWKHLLMGSTLNPNTDQLVGAFGNEQNGYHSELRCLMNGTHDNSIYYGGNGSLRTSSRLCNFCRELLAFRIYERTALLPDPTTSFGTWVTDYRQPFYDEFGFHIPSTVPQENNKGEAKFEACIP